MNDNGDPNTMNNNTSVSLTVFQQDFIIVVRMIMTFLSLLGSLFMLTVIIWYKRYTVLSRRLVLYLTISAFGEAIANLFTLGLYGNIQDEPALCYIQGLLQQFFQISLFLWITVIAINLFSNVVLKNFSSNYELYYIIGVTFFAVLFTAIPLGNYGVAGLWCWISQRGAGSALRFICFYIPLYIMITVVMVLYIMIILNLRKVRKSQDDITKEQKKNSKILVRTLIAYPLIFLGLYIFPTVNRVQDWIEPNYDIFFLWLMHTLTAPALGFANSVAFVLGLDPEMKAKLPCFGSATPTDKTDEEASNSSFDEINISTDTTSG